MLAICTFFVLIPMSKHMHLVMALPNVFFFDTQPVGKMRPLQMDENGTAVSLEELDLETFGASQYTQLSWRSLIDGWACTSCARCQDVCPAYASGKDLNPMQIIHDVRGYANEHSELLLKGEAPEEDITFHFINRNPEVVEFRERLLPLDLSQGVPCHTRSPLSFIATKRTHKLIPRPS